MRRRRQPPPRSGPLRVPQRQEGVILVVEVVVVVDVDVALVDAGRRKTRRRPTIDPLAFVPLKRGEGKLLAPTFHQSPGLRGQLSVKQVML